MKNPGNIISSTLASTVSLWRGTNSQRESIQPVQLLELYDIENCPYCRLVRETLTSLNIDIIIYPSPKGGKRFRAKAEELGGKQQFPFLVDKNTGVNLYESKTIIAYLYSTYGAKQKKMPFYTFELLGSFSSTLTRNGKGTYACESKAAEKNLVLYSFEASPFSRPVRELLCELELPYELRNTGKDTLKDMGPPKLRKTLFPKLPVTGRNRIDLYNRAGKVQVPYLVDDNHQVEMFESAQILDYLLSTYAK